MRASRGMGATKMPKKKTIKRKDDPTSIIKYAKGGKLKPPKGKR